LPPGTTQIAITLPSDVSIAQQIDSTTCQVTDLQIISPTVRCTVIGQVISLINPFSVTYVPDNTQILSFKVAGMVMPPTTKKPGAMVVDTRVQNTTLYSVDSASASELFQATVGTLTESNATAQNTKTYVDSTYVFEFKPQHKILQNGYVTVDLPSQISITNPSSSS
jgi:hypothetical protein